MGVYLVMTNFFTEYCTKIFTFNASQHTWFYKLTTLNSKDQHIPNIHRDRRCTTPRQQSLHGEAIPSYLQEICILRYNHRYYLSGFIRFRRIICVRGVFQISQCVLDFYAL